LFLQRGEVVRPLFQTLQPEPLRAPGIRVLLHDAFDDLPLLATVDADPGQGDLADAQVHQTFHAPRAQIIPVTLRLMIEVNVRINAQGCN